MPCCMNTTNAMNELRGHSNLQEGIEKQRWAVDNGLTSSSAARASVISVFYSAPQNPHIRFPRWPMHEKNRVAGLYLAARDHVLDRLQPGCANPVAPRAGRGQQSVGG